MKNQSTVPKEKYKKDYKSQLVQLKNSPLLKRFKKSREILEKNPHRPYYHVTSPECAMHDANGLCFYKNKWHLFYQAYPPEYPLQHWGHVVSDDLINWKDLPYALYPGPEKACFSGATLVEKNRVLAMYHGTTLGNMIAVSDDDLLINWEKINNGAVIDIDPHGLEYQVFDPCIWKKDDCYYSLSGGYLPYGDSKEYKAAEFLFRSYDLITWEYMHPFVENDVFTLTGDDGACPYFWPIGNKYILLFFSHMSAGQALIGDYDKKLNKFIATSHFKANHGVLYNGGVHAPSATPDKNGGVIVIYNVNTGNKTGVMKSVMTLPRRLTLEDNILAIEPAGDYQSLRYNHRSIQKTLLKADKETSFNNICGNTVEIIANIDVKETNLIEFNVLQSDNEVTKIKYYHMRGYNKSYRNKDVYNINSVLEIDSSRSSISSNILTRPTESMQFETKETEPLNLHIFIDRSIIEVFVNNKECASIRVYPKNPESIGISIMSKGRDTLLNSLSIWNMKKINYRIY
ncbi:MAG: glycoside hydrolase family 32 protein [Clostridiales bacterium]|nr:glycoside hydrolase family 32 protein [Clostridiales bacterium]